MSDYRTHHRALARLFLMSAWTAVMLAACGRDIMAPASAGRAVLLAPVFPRASQLLPSASATTQFTSVRAMLTSALGTVVVDTTVTFPASADSIVLQLTVPISGPVAAPGEILFAQIWCINTDGATVFKGGPVPVVAATGSRVNATLIPLIYVGPGSPGGDTTGVGGVVAAALAIATQPVTSVAGTALALTVDVVDAAGNIVTTFTGPIAIALGGNAGIATLGGTLTANAVNGVATFSNILLTKAASSYSLIATASGLTSATSHAFNINPAAPATTAVTGGNNQSGLLSALLGTPLTVLVRDTYGNATPGIAVAWTIASGGGALASASTVTDANGVATNGWTLGSLLGLQTVTAVAAGLSNAPVSFTATALKGAATSTVSQLVMSVLQSSVTAGATLATIVVSAEDATGNIVSSFASAVQIALASSPSGAALGGTTTASAVNGIAKFPNIVLTKAASGYTLVASGDGLTSQASSTFTVIAAAPASIAKQGGDNQSAPLAALGALLSNPLSVLVTDAYGNPVSGATVNWAVSAGNARLGSATSTTNSNGIATNLLTLLGLLPGVDQVTASVTGAASSVIFTATGVL
jgi:hypothetical protein